jgi:hypothetical protein
MTLVLVQKPALDGLIVRETKLRLQCLAIFPTTTSDINLPTLNRSIKCELMTKSIP